MNTKYNPIELEARIQKKWEENGTYKVEIQDKLESPKYYLLVELPYPSGDLHMGHWFAFSVPDILARLKRMQGYFVFAPVGFDAFGLPAENAAIKRDIHPKDWTASNMEKMQGQFKTMGLVTDWRYKVVTCDPVYYRWNQWIFLKLFEKGLAYRGKILSNWCPVDQTVLAHENVEAGKCWRCGTEVVQKEVEQWFFKLTEFSDRLLWDNSPEVDWPKSLVESQNNWIGKSEGMKVKFMIDGSTLGDEQKRSVINSLEVFTTRADTIFGATFIVVAPEHPLIGELLKGQLITDKEQLTEIEAYVEKSKKKSELERKENKEKTGVFSGVYAQNPVNLEKIPIWISDYVLWGYGTGSIMGVPGSDMRDFEFAKKFDLPVVRVIGSEAGDQSAISGANDVLTQGYIVNSGQFDDLKAPEDSIAKISKFLEKEGFGKREVNYHIHDWSMSRQRYWGTPIPVIYCVNCWQEKSEKSKVQSREGVDYAVVEGEKYAIVPVLEKDLPVELPYKVDFAPKGKAPLATSEEFLNVKCPECGGDARREIETMDTFVDSSWYFLRYLDPKNSSEIFDRELVSKFTPIDVYFGGSEHTVGHTLYSRFFIKFFHDLGLVDYDEYAKKRVHHGVILGTDGARMSKSKGNVVNPDEQVNQFGADAVRMYLAFLGPYDIVAPWNPSGVSGIFNFLNRVWKLASEISDKSEGQNVGKSEDQKVRRSDSSENEVVGLSDLDEQIMHKTIKKVGFDVENIKFNTAISALMEWLNHLYKKSHVSKESGGKSGVSTLEYETFLKLLAPFAPHMTEEIWQFLKSQKSKDQSERFESIHNEKWPEYDEAKTLSEMVTVVVQVNGKVRDSLLIEAESNQETVEKLALESVKVQNFLENKKPQKVIYVGGKLINFVV